MFIHTKMLRSTVAHSVILQNHVGDHATQRRDSIFRAALLCLIVLFHYTYTKTTVYSTVRCIIGYGIVQWKVSQPYTSPPLICYNPCWTEAQTPALFSYIGIYVVEVFVQSVGLLETTLGSWGKTSVVLRYSHICSCNLSLNGQIPTSTLVHLNKTGVVLRCGLLCIVRDVHTAVLHKHKPTLTLVGQLSVVLPNFREIDVSITS
jgi:hypothetical protein